MIHIKLRHVTSADFQFIPPLLNEWWGGREMTDMLPKLFFDHFQDTSLIIEKNGQIIGFLIGFLSQSKKGEAYIHFVGVHPEYRKNKVGQQLYDEFFKIVRKHDCHTVRCITSPVNTGSIQFHLKMGFEILSGDKTVKGIQVKTNYDGENKDRIQFVKKVSLEETK